MISAQIKQFIKEVAKIDFEPDLSVPEVKKFGHYSTNLALRLAKERKQNPIKLAQEIASELLKQSRGMFSMVEGVPPGFINFYLADDFLRAQFAGLAKKPLPKIDLGKGKKVIIDYCATNIAKPMHVGHLRSTIIGDALANIHEVLGYKVIRWNYLGDWGTQFGKLLAAYKLWGDKKAIEVEPIDEMLKLYVRFHEEMKIDPQLEKRGQEEFRKLEAGDRENRKLWKWFVKESLVEFEKIFALLGVKFDTYKGESAYEKDLPGVVAMLKRSIATQSEGAWVVSLSRLGMPPALIEKSDGASLYLTRDIASLYDRLKMKPAKIVYVVANQQALHFEQLFAIAKLLNLTKAELTHVKFGMVLGQDGKKFATREGKVIQLLEVIAEGIDRARKVVESKNPDLAVSEKKHVAATVGVGALKYNDLKENRNSDIRFDWDKMLDLNGDTAPYIQYTYTRLMSIAKKAGAIKRGDPKTLVLESELAIIKKMLDLPDVIALSAHTYLTSHLAKYLFDFTKLVNYYYETTPILIDANDARRAARVALMRSAGLVIKEGLRLLGIGTLERI